MRNPQLSTNASHLERWLGAETCEHLSRNMRDWYGPPIPLLGVPGGVYAYKGGDFRGRAESGGFASIWDVAERYYKQFRRNLKQIAKGDQLNTGFSSLSDLLAARAAGQNRVFEYQKAGATGVIAVTNSLWGVGNQPAAGANASNAPGGDAPTDATTGAFPYANPGGTDTLHIVGGFGNASAVNSLLAYDRIFQVNKTMNSIATEAVTGVPTRYQSTTQGAADSAEGNFLFAEVGGTALAATAHNWTTCLYNDQGGNASTLPSLTGNSGAIARRLDHPVGQWFAPLATGDVGIQALTQMQCSAAVATGVINFVIGHTLCWIPCPIANMICPFDGINTQMSLVRIFDDAAIAFLETTKPATAATNYNIRIDATYG